MEQEIGKVLGKLRRDKGIPATFVAKKIGIARQTLSNKETGKVEFTATEFVEYCRVIGVKTTDVVET